MNTSKTAVAGLVAFVALAALAIAIALRPTGLPVPSAAERKVAATIFPLYDIARHLTGEGIEVVLVTPPGANPHTFEPKPSLIRDLRGAVSLYAIGHGLDDWIDPVLAAEPSMKKIVVDRGISLLDSTEDEGTDPHYWLDAQNGLLIAETIAADLTLSFPDRSEEIRRNLAAYEDALRAADTEIRKELEPLAKRDLVTLHDAWYYFAEAYGLHVIGSFEPSPGRQPSPQYIAALRNAIRLSGTKTVYTEPQISASGLQSFIQDNGLRLVELDPFGGIGNRQSYIAVLRYNAEFILHNQ